MGIKHRANKLDSTVFNCVAIGVVARSKPVKNANSGNNKATSIFLEISPNHHNTHRFFFQKIDCLEIAILSSHRCHVELLRYGINRKEENKMAGLSIWHVLIFAIVVILLFGTSKLKNLGKDVGGAIKDFKKSVKEDETTSSLNEPRTLEHQSTAEVKTSTRS